MNPFLNVPLIAKATKNKFDMESLLLDETLPPEVKKAFGDLNYLCKLHNIPRDLLYLGVAWDVRSYIEKKMADLVMGK